MPNSRAISLLIASVIALTIPGISLDQYLFLVWLGILTATLHIV
ncbi:MAG: hypothetical protein V7K97_18260 [Nostoc sp.]